MDLLYSRYGAGARDILLTEYKVGMDILLLANRKKEEEILFNRWIHSLQTIPFEEYKNQIGYRPHGKKEKEKTAEEIINEVMEVMKVR